MSPLTLFILIVLAVGAILGFINGFVRTLFSWAAPIVAALFANQWAAALAAQFFPEILKNRLWVILFAIGIFFAAAFIIGLVGQLVKKLIDSVRLGLADHLAGFCLGAIFAAVILGFIFAGLIHFKFITDPSPLVNLLSQSALKTFSLLRSAVGR